MLKDQGGQTTEVRPVSGRRKVLVCVRRTGKVGGKWGDEAVRFVDGLVSGQAHRRGVEQMASQFPALPQMNTQLWVILILPVSRRQRGAGDRLKQQQDVKTRCMVEVHGEVLSGQPPSPPTAAEKKPVPKKCSDQLAETGHRGHRGLEKDTRRTYDPRARTRRGKTWR